MKKILGILILILILNSCAASWDEAVHRTENRDARINTFNKVSDSVFTIYIGIGSEKEEQLKRKYYKNRIKYGLETQHMAPKELIAKQQCMRNFNLDNPKLIEILDFSKKEIKQHRLGFKKYAKYSCETSVKKIAETIKETSSNLSKVSNNTLNRTYNCSYPGGKSKIKIRGATASEITSAGINITYSNVNLSDKGAFSLTESSKDIRAWFIGATSFLFLDVQPILAKCN